jgi:hypothetical protein
MQKRASSCIPGVFGGGIRRTADKIWSQSIKSHVEAGLSGVANEATLFVGACFSLHHSRSQHSYIPHVRVRGENWWVPVLQNSVLKQENVVVILHRIPAARNPTACVIVKLNDGFCHKQPHAQQ